MLQYALLLKNKFRKCRKQNPPLYYPISVGLLFYCIVNSCFSQVNLVPNYSFEIYDTCPTAASQIDYATPWRGTNNSTDYYNACAPQYSASVPNQPGSFQYAKTGVAIAGLWNLDGLTNYREYLQVQLMDTLIANQCYFVTFFANYHDYVRFAVNNMGLYFSTDSFSTSWGPAPFIPQILKFGNPIISDTLNWTEITGIYTATGNENYITIGNFFDDANTDTFSTYNGAYPGAYYYIDDVSVIAVGSGSISLWQYNDTSVYVGDSVFIGNEITNLNCTWYDTLGNVLADSVPGIYVSPTTTSNYIVVENLCGNIRTDTITVTINYVGIEEEAALQKIILYPNPSPGGITISGFEKNISTVGLRLSDIRGREMFNKDVDVINGAVELEMPALSAGRDLENGTYLLSVTLPGTKERIVKRVVVQK